jgi:phenylpyruvate tautomerase PptA (4-oxalocrotonate tautomerase family)
MPIIDVLLILPEQAIPEPGAAQAVADAIGKCLNAKPGHVWVRLHHLPAAQYAENEIAVSEAGLPVFLTVLHKVPPEGATRQEEAEALTRAVAQCLARPEHTVHVEYASAGAGRIAFGGKLVQ